MHARPAILSLVVLLLAAPCSIAQPELPDWTTVTFDSGSSVGMNPYFPLQPNWLSAFQGQKSGGLERIETLVTTETITILGVQNRVIRDQSFLNGRLVEVADDWYAQDTQGNVWYFGEYVVNYHYDDQGNPTGTDNAGSWTADGDVNFPGIIMWNNPMIGDEYYQEYAPGVALDFAVVNSLTDMIVVPFGSFDNVLNTSEGNLFDGPDLTDNKLFAPNVGLALIQALDDEGVPEFDIPLISRVQVPTPGAALVLVAGGVIAATRRRRAQ